MSDNGIDLDWGNKHFGARGFAVYVLIGLVAIVGSNFYAGWRTEVAMTRVVSTLTERVDGAERSFRADHRLIKTGQDRTSCILTMNQSAREEFRARFYTGAFKSVCPWMDD